jgi:cytochrome c oxidase subunit 2
MVVFNLIYLGLCVIGLAVFAVIFLSTRKRQRERPMSVAAWKKRENLWFWVVLFALVGALAATISKAPWRADAMANRQIVAVEGVQFGFVFSTTKIHTGQVEFHLSARDVNHAFGLYGPDGVFMAQAQMMPGWPSLLRVDLVTPGKYEVRCFEYCGVGHHTMITTFEVTR